MKTMRTSYMTAVDKMELGEAEVPKPGKGEVLVRVEYVGICGSDVHYFHTGRCGSYVVEDTDYPYVLGHECAGTVEELGEGVTTLKVGDRVALEPQRTCGECEYCKSGRYNLCPDVVFFATPPVAGCNQEYVTFPEKLSFKLPDNVSTKEGALVEPLSVGVHAANQGEVCADDDVVILGAGCIGLVTLLACKSKGAKDITVVDVVESRLNKALELGATRVVNGAKEDTIKTIMDLTGGKGINKVFETAGSPITIAQTPFLVKRGGTITLVGIAAQEEITFNFGQIMDKEPTIKSVFRYRNTYPSAIEDISNGKIDVKGIVSHEFDLDHIQEAYEEAINNKEGVIKAVIKI